jgi:hypothetical protein
MKYEKQVFISYCHKDNKPLTTGEEGWVTKFHKMLEAVVASHSGPKVDTWIDHELAGNDDFEQEILAQIPKTGILVSIISPCYIESAWCNRELKAFCEKCGEVKVGRKFRIIKVMKFPVGKEPPPMDKMDGYDFYTYDESRFGEHAFELDPINYPDRKQLYIQKVSVLADDIIHLMQMVESGGGEPPQPLPSSRQVYLAQCSWDQKEAREAVEIDLRQQGYSLFPQGPLPTDEAAYTAAVSEALEQCGMSIHMVGRHYGFVPDGPSGKSAVILQNDMSVAQARKKPFRRIIWLPAGPDSSELQQKQFIDALHRDSEKQFCADLITGDLEALKSAIHTTLQSLEKKDSPVAGPPCDPNARLLYLICDKQDREAVLPIRKLLLKQGFDVQVPLFDGNAETVDHARHEMLTLCRGVVVFYGKGDEAWKHAVDFDLIKSRGYRNQAPNPVTVTYLAEPSTIDKIELMTVEQPNLINGLEGFSSNIAAALLQSLQGV